MIQSPVLEFDMDRFPLVVLDLTQAFTNYDFKILEHTMQPVIEGDRPFGVALRTGGLPMPELALLKRLSAWTKRNRELVSRHAVGTALCLQSPLMRGALTFVNRVSPPPTPRKVFTDWEAAQVWVVARLAEAGHQVPDKNAAAG